MSIAVTSVFFFNMMQIIADLKTIYLYPIYCLYIRGCLQNNFLNMKTNLPIASVRPEPTNLTIAGCQTLLLVAIARIMFDMRACLCAVRTVVTSSLIPRSLRVFHTLTAYALNMWVRM